MPVQDLTVWNQRWTLLNNNLEQLAICFSDATELAFPRKATLYSVVRRLQTFAKSHFSFFYEGFSGTPNHSFVDSNEYPAEYALSLILSQIAYDFELLEKAANQRSVDGVCETYTMRDALDKSDRLAMAALQPAITAGLIPKNTTVVTYFQKTTTVRIIPYAPVAFIGVPYTAVTVPRDLLAIPHEIAHYLFRHGNLPANNQQSIYTILTEKLKTNKFWIRNWAEEMFADAYGCLMGGPVMALDFQDLQIDNRGKEFKADREDIEDPVPLLRPDIYAKVLQTHAAQDIEWLRLNEMLHTYWKSRRRKQLALDETIKDKDISFTTVNSTVSLAEAMSLTTNLDSSKPLDQAIKIILDDILIPLNLPLSKWSGKTKELANITTENELQKLYENFETFINQTVFSKPNEYITDASTTIWEEWLTKQEKNSMTNFSPRTGEITEKIWRSLLLANGWVTRGPKNNPTGG